MAATHPARLRTSRSRARRQLPPSSARGPADRTSRKTDRPVAGAAAAPLHGPDRGVPLHAAHPGAAPANTFYKSLPGAGTAAAPLHVSDENAPAQPADGTPVRFYDENTKGSGIRPLSHGAPRGSGAQHTLQAVRVRLEGAYATAVVARQAILRHAADHDLEIARCLAHGVIAVLTDLRAIASSSAAHGSPADGVPPKSSTASAAPNTAAELRLDAVRSTTADRKELARSVHLMREQLEGEKTARRTTAKRSRKNAVRNTRAVRP
jgi:hypothetical protein